MNKKEKDIQIALGTIKREKYKVSFVYQHERTTGRAFFYLKTVFAYSREDATEKVMVAFAKDPRFKTGPLKNHKPHKYSFGFRVQKWERYTKDQGAWVNLP